MDWWWSPEIRVLENQGFGHHFQMKVLLSPNEDHPLRVMWKSRTVQQTRTQRLSVIGHGDVNPHGLQIPNRSPKPLDVDSHVFTVPAAQGLELVEELPLLKDRTRCIGLHLNLPDRDLLGVLRECPQIL